MRFVNMPSGLTIDALIVMCNENFARLAKSVGKGGTTIENTTINSTVVSGGGGGPWFSITYGATITVDAANGKNQRVVLAGDAVLADPVGWADGDELVLRIQQDATGGRTLTLATPAKWELPAGLTLYGITGQVITLHYTFDSAGKALLTHVLQI